MHDNVYVDKQQHIVDFAFNKDVVAVFPDMIRRSVPGYETIIPMTGLIAARHLGDEGTAYDLGLLTWRVYPRYFTAEPSS